MMTALRIYFRHWLCSGRIFQFVWANWGPISVSNFRTLTAIVYSIQLPFLGPVSSLSDHCRIPSSIVSFYASTRNSRSRCCPFWNLAVLLPPDHFTAISVWCFASLERRPTPLHYLPLLYAHGCNTAFFCTSRIPHFRRSLSQFSNPLRTSWN